MVKNKNGWHLGVVTSAAAEQVAAIGARRILITDAARRAQNALLGVLHAVVGRLVDVDQVRLAQRRLPLRLDAPLQLRVLRRLHRYLSSQIKIEKFSSLSCR